MFAKFEHLRKAERSTHTGGSMPPLNRMTWFEELRHSMSADGEKVPPVSESLMKAQ